MRQMFAGEGGGLLGWGRLFLGGGEVARMRQMVAEKGEGLLG